MKTITLIALLLLFFGFSAFGSLVVVMALVDRSFLNGVVSGPKIAEEIQVVPVDRCSSKEKVAPTGTKDPVLTTLATHEETCESFVTDRLMVFTDMPKDSVIAATEASKMATRLKEFHAAGVTPIVIVEPSSAWGLVDFQEFNTGFYDAWIDTYFQNLKRSGVTEEQMGIWVPFPEANIPTWNKNGATPKDFAFGVNRYAKILTKHYPGAHVSILLNSATYDNEDYDWLYGEYVSLAPYVEQLDKNLIKSVGLQGFPWAPRLSSASNPLDDPAQFLNHRLAAEAADIVGVKEIWFNTGTFGAKYTLEPTEAVSIEAETRKVILDGIVEEAKALKTSGYNVWVNLFIEDKSEVTEQTDWSYKTDADKQVFKDFVRSLSMQATQLALFDQVLPASD